MATKELRGDAPAELVAALDALAMANGLNRHEYCVDVLSKHVFSELKKVSVVAAALRGNPLLEDSRRNSGGV